MSLCFNADFGRDAADVHALDFGLDTSSFYSILSSALVAELKLPAMMLTAVPFQGRTWPRVRIGTAYLRLMEREGLVPFAVIDVPRPLLGITALEALGLRLNPQENVLEHAGAYGFGTLVLDEEDF